MNFTSLRNLRAFGPPSSRNSRIKNLKHFANSGISKIPKVLKLGELSFSLFKIEKPSYYLRYRDYFFSYSQTEEIFFYISTNGGALLFSLNDRRSFRFLINKLKRSCILY